MVLPAVPLLTHKGVRWVGAARAVLSDGTMIRFVHHFTWRGGACYSINVAQAVKGCRVNERLPAAGSKQGA